MKLLASSLTTSPLVLVLLVVSTITLAFIISFITTRRAQERDPEERHADRLTFSYRPLVVPFMVIAAIAIAGIPPAIFHARGEFANSGTTFITSFHTEKFAKIALNVPGDVKATLYFGSLDAITTHLKGQVQFNLPKRSSDSASNNVCAETVVFANVTGKQGVVYAQGTKNLSAGWALERPPTQQISQPFNTLHQQIIATSPSLKPGSTWQIAAMLRTDSMSLTTQNIRFVLQTTEGPSQVWFINYNQLVTCYHS